MEKKKGTITTYKMYKILSGCVGFIGCIGVIGAVLRKRCIGISIGTVVVALGAYRSTFSDDPGRNSSTTNTPLSANSNFDDNSTGYEHKEPSDQSLWIDADSLTYILQGIAFGCMNSYVIAMTSGPDRKFASMKLLGVVLTQSSCFDEKRLITKTRLYRDISDRTYDKSGIMLNSFVNDVTLLVWPPLICSVVFVCSKKTRYGEWKAKCVQTLIFIATFVIQFGKHAETLFAPICQIDMSILLHNALTQFAYSLCMVSLHTWSRRSASSQ